MFIPGYLLERLYVQDSLKNTEDGFEFVMRNVVDSGTLTRLTAIEVDGAAIPLENVTVVKDDKTIKATDLSPNAPLFFPVGSTLTVKVSGQALEPGAHQIMLKVNTWEAGGLSIPIKAELKA
ncbi:MAG: hypothetical protein Kow0047_13820 [Anaerolineae bacterium]